MFSKILKSKARKAVLKILFDGSDGKRQKYYLRELAEMMQYSAGSLQREIAGMELDGIVLSEKVGNMKFFSLNKKSALVAELKKFMAHSPKPIFEKKSVPATTKEPAPAAAPPKSEIKVEIFQTKKKDPIRMDIL